MKKILIKLIEIYQAVLSPDHSYWSKRVYPYGYCRFHPTCSEYAKKSLADFGTLTALRRTGWRLLRCNPFSKGGVDF